MSHVSRLAGFVLLYGGLSIAQESTSLPRFEVASIKPTVATDGFSRSNSDRGMLFLSNNSLLTMVKMAFGVPDFRVVAPAWMAGERFDVTAKFAEGSTGDQRRSMMQTLLAERFHLAYHREDRLVPGYALVVAKGGPKIHPVADKGDRNANTGATRFIMEQMPMEEVANQLTGKFQQPVKNETGLDGVYTFSLVYSPETVMKSSENEPAGPSIFTAFEEQLGLKLEARKIAVGIVVIDRCDRTPSEN